MVKLTHWSDVPLFRYATGRALDVDERTDALQEYRTTGAIAGVVMVDPGPGDVCLSWAEEDRICNSGPAPDQIDWSGFDVWAGLDVEGRPVRSHG